MARQVITEEKFKRSKELQKEFRKFLESPLGMAVEEAMLRNFLRPIAPSKVESEGACWANGHLAGRTDFFDRFLGLGEPMPTKDHGPDYTKPEEQ